MYLEFLEINLSPPGVSRIYFAICSIFLKFVANFSEVAILSLLKQSHVIFPAFLTCVNLYLVRSYYSVYWDLGMSNTRWNLQHSFVMHFLLYRGCHCVVDANTTAFLEKFNGGTTAINISIYKLRYNINIYLTLVEVWLQHIVQINFI